MHNLSDCFLPYGVLYARHWQLSSRFWLSFWGINTVTKFNNDDDGATGLYGNQSLATKLVDEDDDRATRLYGNQSLATQIDDDHDGAELM